MTATITVSIPGRFGDYWLPAQETWEMDLDNPKYVADFPKQAAAARGALDKYAAGTWVKRGRGHTMTVELTVEEARWFRSEALYRWEFNGGNGNPYGCEDPNPADRNAAKTLLDRLDAALAAVEVAA